MTKIDFVHLNTNRAMVRRTHTLLLICIFLTTNALAQHGGGDRQVGPSFATRSPVMAKNGLAATTHPLATQIAIDVLQRGGNAVDAAIAANAAQGFMEPAGNGIGGDLFAIVYDPKTDSLYGLNASGRSPKGLSYEEMQQELGDEQYIPAVSPLSVTVPGAVDGWFTLHERFGSMPMADVLQPTIRYAHEGVPLPPVIASYFPDSASGPPMHDNLFNTYMPDGRALKAGDVFRNPDLARTLERIAEGGRDAFYEGTIAKTIDAYMRRVGGYLRAEDLAAHTSTWVNPVSTTYRGYKVYELPPNGQGIAALEMLNILEGYDLKSMGHNSADYLHAHIEAKKLAFADRARYYADPAFADLPVETLISKEYGSQRRQLIDMSQARQQVHPGPLPSQKGDTIYLTVADSSGMMVSLIQSIFYAWGSKLVPDGLGFALQNRGALFTMEQGHPNVYAPGKRPFHTIIPAFVTKDGEPFLSFGVMGGAMQPQGHVQVLSNIIDFGMNVQEAGDAARYRHTGSSQPTGQVMTDGGTVRLETGVAPEVIEELRRRGHHVIVGEGFFGGYQAIRWDPVQQVYHGASEMRKDGQAAGY